MKIIKGSLAFTLAFLISVSLTSGLQLTASTGGNDGSSSTTVLYGATVNDYADEQIGLNPGAATLAKSGSGTGNLPFSSLSLTDANGNSVSVSRSVYGTSAATTWNYDWWTYYPYSATAGYGVGAWMTLTASNAYQVYGRGSSSNTEGDVAGAYIQVGSSSPYTTSSLIGYSINPTAFTNEARVYQSAISATSTGPITAYGSSNNNAGDYTVSSIYANKGTVITPKTNVYAGKTSSWSYPSASSIETTGYARLYASASNSEGDSSEFRLDLTNGKVFAPYFYGWSGTSVITASTAASTTKTIKYAETWGKVSNAYGTSVKITTKGLDKAVGYQVYDGCSTKVENGEGYFAALKTNNDQFGTVSVKTKSTIDDVVISTDGFGANTALILDPFYWKYVTKSGAVDIKDTVVNSLLKKGYAVTYYRDSAVSKDIVGQMDEYKVSAIHTDTTINTLALSKSTDGINADTMTAAELKAAYTNSNGMTLIVGSNSFKSTAAGTLGDAVSKAEVRGGTTKNWAITFGRNFINRYFTAMGNGYTAYNANNYAMGTSTAKLYLLGNTAFKL
jgi:hypothetical protein